MLYVGEDSEYRGDPIPEPIFETYKDKAGEYRFRLKAANGKIIVTGEGYATMQACLRGIESIKKNAVEAKIVDEGQRVGGPTFEIFRDKSLEYRFRLKAANGQIVAVSEGYTSRERCFDGIASVEKNASIAKIIAT